MKDDIKCITIENEGIKVHPISDQLADDKESLVPHLDAVGIDRVDYFDN